MPQLISENIAIILHPHNLKFSKVNFKCKFIINIWLNIQETLVKERILYWALEGLGFRSISAINWLLTFNNLILWGLISSSMVQLAYFYDILIYKQYI